MLRVALAGLHLLALGLGLGAVLFRGTALREPPTAASLTRAFRADTLWGVAAALWIGSGLWRALAGTEKSLQYYLHNPRPWLAATERYSASESSRHHP